MKKELYEKYWNGEVNYRFESVLNGGWEDYVSKYNKLLNNKELYEKMVDDVSNAIIENDYLWETINDTIDDLINNYIECHKNELEEK